MMLLGPTAGSGFLLLAAFSLWHTPDGIAGSKHDFSRAPWNDTNEICVTCHVPHMPRPPVEFNQLLWSHQETTATFNLYTSPYLSGTPEQPVNPSRLCLGCHDGTVALDSFNGRSGSTHLTGPGLIGTDLKADHPISIKWTHKSSKRCGTCHRMHGPDQRPTPFPDGRVECTSCHEPHSQMPFNAGGQNMLRLTMEQSQLCLFCHAK